jgi:exportin-T
VVSLNDTTTILTFDQTRFAFARILATAGPRVTHFIPTLMTNLLAHFEPSELADFMNFIGLLIHKLQVCSLLRQQLRINH